MVLPVYRGSSVAIAALQSVSDGDSDSAAWMGAALILPLWLLTIYLHAFARLERRIGRERELRADLIAARQTSSSVVASALTKVHAFAPAWSGVERLVIDAAKEHKGYRNVSRMFADWAAGNTGELVSRTLTGSQSELTHPTDSHPPLRDRLLNLGISEPIPGLLPTGEPAVALVPDLERLEEELSELLSALAAQLVSEGRTP